MWCDGLEKKAKKVTDGKMSRDDYEEVRRTCVACSSRLNREKVLQKFYDQEYKQDTLLYVAVHLLLNLAEDTRIEVKAKMHTFNSDH